MLCSVRYLFVISTSVINCLGRFVPEMTYYVSSGTLNFAQLNSTTEFKGHLTCIAVVPAEHFRPWAAYLLLEVHRAL